VGYLGGDHPYREVSSDDDVLSERGLTVNDSWLHYGGSPGSCQVLRQNCCVGLPLKYLHGPSHELLLVLVRVGEQECLSEPLKPFITRHPGEAVES